MIDITAPESIIATTLCFSFSVTFRRGTSGWPIFIGSRSEAFPLK